MMAVNPFQGADTWRLSAAYEPHKIASSVPDEIGPHVRPPLIVRRFTHGLCCHFDGAPCDLFLRLTRPAGQFFNRTPIPIPCVEIHHGVDAGWIRPQHLLHEAEMLKDLSPVQLRKLSQTGKRIANRYLIARLAVLLTQVEIGQRSPERALQPDLDRH